VLFVCLWSLHTTKSPKKLRKHTSSAPRQCCDDCELRFPTRFKRHSRKTHETNHIYLTYKSFLQGTTLVLEWWFDKFKSSSQPLSWQRVKLTSFKLSSGTCHHKWNLSLTQKICQCQPANLFMRMACASDKVFARFHGHVSACSSLSKISVFGWTRCKIWPWHYPSPTSFSWYK